MRTIFVEARSEFWLALLTGSNAKLTPFNEGSYTPEGTAGFPIPRGAAETRAASR